MLASIMRRCRTALIVLLTLCTAPATPSHAREKHPREQHLQDTGFLNRTLTLNGATYRYVVYLPFEYNSRESWPVILFLHGSGERGSDGMDETQAGLPAAIRSHPDRWPFVVVMPQVPYNHHHWTDPDMMSMALAALDAEVREFHGNPDQVYLTGLSLGGYGVWEIAKDYPGRFAALVPVSGGIFWSYEPQRWHEPNLPAPYVKAIGKTPVWIFHGTLDPIVAPKQSEIMYSALASAGGDVRLWEFEGLHHNAWDRAYGERSLPGWLLAHKLSQIAAATPHAERLTVPLHPVPARVNPEIYAAYEGDYYDGEVRELTVFRQADRLFSRNRTGDLNELLPESPATFFFPTGSTTRFTFEKDSSGRVTAVLYRDDRHEERWEREKK